MRKNAATPAPIPSPALFAWRFGEVFCFDSQKFALQRDDACRRSTGFVQMWDGIFDGRGRMHPKSTGRITRTFQSACERPIGTGHHDSNPRVAVAASANEKADNSSHSGDG